LPARLDAIDRHILKELQDDGRITNVELASRVGISAPPCLRRVRALEEAGYIGGYRALLVEKLTAAPQVRNVKTSLTLRRSKDAAMVPMED
jgi:DNA-binding Lrp family transcriptional regulator